MLLIHGHVSSLGPISTVWEYLRAIGVSYTSAERGTSTAMSSRSYRATLARVNLRAGLHCCRMNPPMRYGLGIWTAGAGSAAPDVNRRHQTGCCANGRACAQLLRSRGPGSHGYAQRVSSTSALLGSVFRPLARCVMSLRPRLRAGLTSPRPDHFALSGLHALTRFHSPMDTGSLRCIHGAPAGSRRPTSATHSVSPARAVGQIVLAISVRRLHGSSPKYQI